MSRLLFCIFLFSKLFAGSFVTYTFNGGRFGDNLITYIHTKWIAYHYDLPLLYKPFRWSSELVLDDKEMRFESHHAAGRVFQICRKFPQPLPGSFLFVCDYFGPDRNDLFFQSIVDWKDEKFRNILREMIAPKKNLHLINPPKNTINIAIHIREGGRYDPPGTALGFPMKLPPLDFYCEGLVKIIHEFQGKKPMYCHIFTDALHPEALVEKIEEALPTGSDITFHYRRENNHDEANVLEDFFSLFHFDILIRSDSSFSVVPSLLHDYAIVYFPKEYTIQDGVVKITKADLQINEDLLKNLLR